MLTFRASSPKRAEQRARSPTGECQRALTWPALCPVQARCPAGTHPPPPANARWQTAVGNPSSQATAIGRHPLLSPGRCHPAASTAGHRRPPALAVTPRLQRPTAVDPQLLTHSYEPVLPHLWAHTCWPTIVCQQVWARLPTPPAGLQLFANARWPTRPVDLQPVDPRARCLHRSPASGCAPSAAGPQMFAHNRWHTVAPLDHAARLPSPPVDPQSLAMLPLLWSTSVGSRVRSAASTSPCALVTMAEAPVTGRAVGGQSGQWGAGSRLRCESASVTRRAVSGSSHREAGLVGQLPPVPAFCEPPLCAARLVQVGTSDKRARRPKGLRGGLRDKQGGARVGARAFPENGGPGAPIPGSPGTAGSNEVGGSFACRHARPNRKSPPRASRPAPAARHPRPGACQRSGSEAPHLPRVTRQPVTGNGRPAPVPDAGPEGLPSVPDGGAPASVPRTEGPASPRPTARRPPGRGAPSAGPRRAVRRPAARGRSQSSAGISLSEMLLMQYRWSVGVG